jgi:uncharacterized membrane protein YfcA
MDEFGSYLLLAVVGASGGVVAGVVGLAGGIVIVPLIIWMYGTEAMADAIVVSFFAVFFNSLSTSVGNRHSRGGQEFWTLVRSVRWYTLGAVLAALVVAALFGRYRAAIPKQLLACLQLALAVCMLMPRSWYDWARLRPNRFRDTLVGSAVGGVSTLIGVGGGTYTIAYGLLNGRGIKDCTLTANFVGIFIGLMSIVGYYGYVLLAPSHASGAHASLIDATGKAILIVAGVLFGQLGVKLQALLPAQAIKQAIVLVLMASSSYVLLRA